MEGAHACHSSLPFKNKYGLSAALMARIASGCALIAVAGFAGTACHRARARARCANYGLSSHSVALITSDCGQMRGPDDLELWFKCVALITSGRGQMALITSDCGLDAWH